MPIDENLVLDAIGVDSISGEVVLSLFDSDDWSDVAGHLMLLERKLNAYIGFIETGEILEKCPAGANKKVRIDVISRYELPARALEYLAKVRGVLNSIGVDLRSRSLDSLRVN